MNKIYFVSNLSDNFFPDKNVKISRWSCTPEFVRGLIKDNKLISCLDLSHQEMVRELEERFQIYPQISVKPLNVQLNHGDAAIVMGISYSTSSKRKPEYISEEITKVDFRFAMYVLEN